MLCDLTTRAGETLTGTPWTVYPRPQMRRDSYVNLNGQWDFSCHDYEGKITVPFCPESQLSGVKRHFADGLELLYTRRFTLPRDFCRGRVLLHIGAADQFAGVYLNDTSIGSHIGGYTNASFDITDALRAGENCLEICCRDDLDDKSMPYGKQVIKRGGMWYTPVSGIWQTVWLESVPEQYVEKLHITNRGQTVEIAIEPVLAGKITVSGLGAFALENGKAIISPENPHLWSPEDPYLYDFTLEAGEDKIESYFAIRSLEIKEVGGCKRLCLNGKPYFFHGLLDQGYWPDGIYTPASPECYAEDILAMKRLGFNTLRKHIKVEPEEFYYQCDKLGMVVFQDMVNNGDYNFLRDTALPTIGIQKLNDKMLHRNEKTRKRFLKTMEEVVAQLKNHPCICYWTIFNEGWGQFHADAVCDKFRTLDDTRLIDATSGWFRRKNSDVDSRHVYFKPIRLKAGEKPLVLSEFGGFVYKVEGHSFNPDKTYGYGSCRTREDFSFRLRELYLMQVLPAVEQGLCAAIYTQISDVEDETNGLLTYDRKVCKLDPEEMLPIAQALQAAIE